MASSEQLEIFRKSAAVRNGRFIIKLTSCLEYVTHHPDDIRKVGIAKIDRNTVLVNSKDFGKCLNVKLTTINHGLRREFYRVARAVDCPDWKWLTMSPGWSFRNRIRDGDGQPDGSEEANESPSHPNVGNVDGNEWCEETKFDEECDFCS
jgi:hypothetical protein